MHESIHSKTNIDSKGRVRPTNYLRPKDKNIRSVVWVGAAEERGKLVKDAWSKVQHVKDVRTLLAERLYMTEKILGRIICLALTGAEMQNDFIKQCDLLWNEIQCEK